MCGRYSIELAGPAIQERFRTAEPPSFDGTYNAAPQQRLPIVTRDDELRGVCATWGFRPDWMDEPDGFINARLESADEKRSFADAWHHRRCLVPATGFFEWSGQAGGKTPYYFHGDQDVYSFAGLWTNEDELTYTVLTRPANSDMEGVHDRMPVMLNRGEEGSWLLGRLSKQDLLTSRPSLTHHPVTRAVNTPSNDGEFLTQAQQGLGEFKSD